MIQLSAHIYTSSSKEVRLSLIITMTTMSICCKCCKIKSLWNTRFCYKEVLFFCTICDP